MEGLDSLNLDLYRKLFVHRSDVFAEQHEDGHYEPVRRPIDEIDVAEHLEGFTSYGVYVIDPEAVLPPISDPPRELVCTPNSVKYVVFDLDTYDSDALSFLTRAVERLVRVRSEGEDWDPSEDALRCLLLEDSGGKGYHIWLFLSEPTSARKVRAWTETIATQYRAVAQTAVGDPWPPLEIFPKQDEVQEGAFGNLVKLPFGVHARTKARAYIVPRPGWAGALEAVEPFPAALIPEPPERAVRSPSGTAGNGRAAPFACISRIISEGAGKGIRDNALYQFCRYAVACGAPDEIVAEWAATVNEGFDPPLWPNEVSTKVRSATTATTPNPGCSADWLRDYCPGGEHCYAPWNDRTPSGDGAQRAPKPDQANTVTTADAFLTPEQRRAKRLENQ